MKNKQLIAYLLFFSSIIPSFGQVMSRGQIDSFSVAIYKIAKLNRYILTEKIDSAMLILEDQSIEKYLTRRDYFYISKLYFKLGNASLGKSYFEKYVSNPYTFFDDKIPNQEDFKKDTVYLHLWEHYKPEQIYAKLVRQRQSNDSIVLKKLDIRDELMKLKPYDQLFRFDRNQFKKIVSDAFNMPYSPDDTLFSQNCWKIQQNLDSMNRIELGKLLKRNNDKWFSESLFGYKASYNAFLVVQHSDLDVNFQQIHMPLLIQSYLETGERGFLAYMVFYLIDRICVNTADEQYFGSQFRVIDAELKLKKMVYGEEFADEIRSYCRFPSLAKYKKDSSEKVIKK